MREVERRISRLEDRLGSSREPETVSDMFGAMQRRAYGDINLTVVVTSILSNGGSGEQLRGKIPDLLLDALVKHLGDSIDGEDGREVDGL